MIWILGIPSAQSCLCENYGMPQCEQCFEDGKRCSNQACPGSCFCEVHWMSGIAVDTSGLDTVLPTSPGSFLESPKATPSSAGQKPAILGLRPDERSILVARRGLIFLPASEGTRAVVFNRMVRVLSLLGQTLDLAAHVRLLRPRRADGFLLLVTPPDPRARNLSSFYDIAASAARMAKGQLYVGRRMTFVQYRDGRAPRGYDVPDFQLPVNGDELRLIDPRGTHVFARAALIHMPLAGLCLRISPVGSGASPLPRQLYALAPRALYGIVAGYLRAHSLHYRLAPLHAAGGERLLFQIGPRADARARQIVPQFVLDYLSRLPHVVLLFSASPDGAPQFLVPWQHRYPLVFRSIAGAFVPDEMVLLLVPPDPSLRIRPAPSFVDGDMLTTAHAPGAAPARLRARPAGKAPALRMSILMRPDNGPAPPVAALILTPQEVRWLRQLLYRLPGDVFSAYSLYQGDDVAFLLGGDRELNGIPFGLPLRRLAGVSLFIPLRSRFVPDLPPALLREALDVRDGTYTVLADDYRLDLPVADCLPLTRSLLAEFPPRQVRLQVHPASALPELAWSFPRTPAAEADAHEPLSGPAVAPHAAAAAQHDSTPTSNPEGIVALSELLQERARAYEEADDFLAAAICYSLLNDEGSRARCYRRAATAPPTGRR